MCAIFGWFKPDSRLNKKVMLRHLARKAQAFGDKSFGLATLKEGKVSVVKYTGAASQWLEQNAKDLEKIAKTDVLLGHTRLPTHGAVTKNNCHPFQIGDWIAAHNGCISNSKELHNKADFVAHGETDSEEALCYIVGKEFSKESLHEIEGSFAFEAVKNDGAEVVLVVDDRSRLSVARSGDGIVWCTDSSILYSAMKAAGAADADVRRVAEKTIRWPAQTTEDISKPPDPVLDLPGLYSPGEDPEILAEARSRSDVSDRQMERQRRRFGWPK